MYCTDPQKVIPTNQRVLLGSKSVLKCPFSSQPKWNIHLETTNPPPLIAIDRIKLTIKRTTMKHQNLIFWCEGLDFQGNFFIGAGQVEVFRK